ncbi:hypothetical protein MASR2M44_13460 [Bacteroidota bacterium]
MRTKSNLLLLLFIAIGTVAFPQYQSYNYYIAFSGKYFKSDGKNGVQRGFDSRFIHPDVIDHQNGYATISDNKGNLIYYTDGYSIFNNKNQKVKDCLNRTSLVKLSIKFLFKISGTSESFVSIAQTTNKVYVQFFNQNGVYLIDSSFVLEPVAGYPGIMNHCSGKGNWLLIKIRDANTYKSYYLDSTGIRPNPVISIITSNRVFNFTNHFFSPNSRYFTVFSSTAGLNSPFDCDIFSFNSETGIVMHKKNLFMNRSVETKNEFIINSPFASFSPEGKNILLFGRFLPRIGASVSKSGTAIFRYNIEEDKTEMIFTSNELTLIFPRFFNLINPKQLVYVINSGFTIAEVDYGYSPQSRLFSIENSDSKNSNNIFFKDYIVSADTIAYDIFNGYPSQNYLPVQESTLQIKVSCIPEKSTFTVESKLPIYDVKWDYGDGQTAAGSSQTSHSYASPGTYFVKALVTLCGQVDTLLDTLIVEQKPDLSYLRDTSICEGNSVQFMRPANQLGIWNTTDTNAVFVCKQEGKYAFTAENSCGKFSKSFEVKTVKPFVKNPPQEHLICGSYPQLKSTQLADLYQWNTGAVTSVILVDTPGLYVLKLSNACFTETEEFVVKQPAQESRIFLPNAISYNGDGLNENWQPITSGIQYFTYSIFSRWGDLLFSGNEKNPVWYPTDIQEGVYLVQVAYQPDCQEIQHKKGTITIIK